MTDLSLPVGTPGNGRQTRRWPRGWQQDLRTAIGDASYILLKASGWVAGTLLASLGVFVLFFLMLGNFTALGFFSQVANLGTRFVAADQARRAAFGDQLFVVWLVAFGIVAVTRVRLLGAIITSTKGPRHG